MRVAKSYINYEYDETKAYEKNGRLYVHATCKCPRCGGLGIIVARVENGQPIPIPVDQGICYECNGDRFISKEIRLYTDKEFDQMEKAKEKAKEKKKAEQEAKMKAEFSVKKASWLQNNGFNEAEESYIVIGDSYSIKDELKSAGFRWNGLLRRWMRGSAEGYEDKVVKIKAENVLEFSAWGEGHFFSDAKDYVDKLIFAKEAPKIPSEYVGEIGDRLSFDLTIIKIGGFEGHYGYTYIYSFKDKDENLLTWFSSKDIGQAVGDHVNLTGTIKGHEIYNGQKVTYITRCRMK